MSWLQKIMYGRYGGDYLSVFLIGLYLLLHLTSLLPHLWVLSWVALVPGLVAILRMFSRNIPRRRAENAKFLKLVGPFLAWCHLQRARHKDKDHSYFKCPNCGQHLRVPKGKGKISITCRSCGVSFEEKS